MSKKQLGQFYTTNYEYILQGLSIPYNGHVIEPFAGRGDLLSILSSSNKLELYDIDPKSDNIIKRDTLINPPSFENKYVLTNPPYLAKNKSSSKTIFNIYNQDDYYKCFIEILLNNPCLGGILILPLNFFCSIRKNDVNLRCRFLNLYNIILLNIFEEQVFDDTSYTICSFQFEHNKNSKIDTIKSIIYPSKCNYNFILNDNYTIGGEIYYLPQSSKYQIERATASNKNNPCLTNLLLKCIDDSINSKISLTVVNDNKRYIDNTIKLSARSYATPIITPSISIEQQHILAEKFNIYLNEMREKYHSLFLTNYRESTTIARKRISFKLAFQIMNYILNILYN